MKISYGLTVCNEHEEIKNLIEFIIEHKQPEDEIVVVYDQNRVTDEVMNVLKSYLSVDSYPFDFQQNFLDNKNFLNSKCTGDYIFQLDADEVPNYYLMAYLPTLLEINEGVDLLITPRKNLVAGLTQEHIQKWGWRVNEQGWVNYPDYQMRIYKRTDEVVWMNKVHERITGYTTFSNFPAEEHWSLYHPKDIKRQEKQNEFYETI